jgi:hypothetical protein
MGWIKVAKKMVLRWNFVMIVMNNQFSSEGILFLSAEQLGLLSF